MTPNKRRIYLDHAATTPVDVRVIEAMQPYWAEHFGNTSSIHSVGREAQQGLDQARQTVAEVLGSSPQEIVFTGCGTESDNLAIRGVAFAAREAKRGQHIITLPIEHHAVGATVEQTARLVRFRGDVCRGRSIWHGRSGCDRAGNPIGHGVDQRDVCQ